jgi:hypothetical protein
MCPESSLPSASFSWQRFSEKELTPSRKSAKAFEQIQQTVVIEGFGLSTSRA